MNISDFEDENYKKLLDMYAPEELHDDLKPYLRNDTMIPMVHHPLVVSVATPSSHKMLNSMYVQKKKAVEQALENGHINQYIFLHERPYRIDALIHLIENDLINDPKEYWSSVGKVWIDSENIHQMLQEWIEIWDADIPKREFAMNENERKEFSKLPKIISVWRGAGHEHAVGMSWTTNKEKAEWFAKRFSHDGRSPHVIEGTVIKNKVLAFFTRRNEDEIVAFPNDVIQ